MASNSNTEKGSSLKSVVADAQARKARNGNNGSSDKNPSFYNRQKNDFVLSMINHGNPIVRVAACSSNLVPVTRLSKRLAIEEDATVLRAILMNPGCAAKDIIAFVSDVRCDLLGNDDKELEEFIADRLK